ncbi:MAG: hybrid sensor histidine kinase/response regulator transcription factor [Thermoflexibacter sp.]
MSKRKKLYQQLLFITFVWLVSKIEAQGIRFSKITTEEGLSQNTAYSIAQDKNGLIWIGTSDGLNKYDGNKITTYYHIPKDSTSLPNSFASALFVDKDKNLWVGTLRGLSLYDYEKDQFTNFPKDEKGREIARIEAIIEDSDNTLLIATSNLGLKKFDKKSGQFSSYLSFCKESKASDCYIKSLAKDAEGNLYIGTIKEGLFILNKKTGVLDSFKNEENNSFSIANNFINSILISKDQSIWIGTYGGGLNKFDKKKRQFIAYRYDENNPQSLGSDYISDVLETSTGELWVATEAGGLNLLQHRGEGITFKRFQKNLSNPSTLNVNELVSMFEDEAGVLWVGTVNGGVHYFDLKKRHYFLYYRSEENNPNSLSYNSLRRIFEDKEGNLWVCATQKGINMATPQDRIENRFQHPPYQLENVDLEEYKNAPYNFSVDICQDKRGIVWLATFGGLFEYKEKKFVNRLAFNPKDTNALHLPSRQVRSLLADSQDNLWIGMVGALAVWNPHRTNLSILFSDTKKNEAIFPQGCTINYLIEDKKGNIWIGIQSHGIRVYNPKNNTFKTYLHNNNDSLSLVNDRLISIYADQQGTVWIGTSGGLSRFNEISDNFTNFGKKNGFPNEVIYGILEDNENNLWLSSNKGLIKFNKKNYQITTFDANDGLQSNEFNINAFHKNSKGEMFFGGVNGFNAFFPEKIQLSTYKPKVIITEFQLFNKPERNYGEDYILKKHISESKEIVLSYNDYIFGFEFSALHFSNRAKIKYAYKMQGFDKDWNYTDAKRPFATYTNLSPNTYTFLVKATNGDGIWNEEATSLRVVITPPFWQTWWFIFLMILSILATLFFLYQWRIRQIKAHKIILEKLVKERTQDLALANEKLENSLKVMEAQKGILEKQTQKLQNVNAQLLELSKFKEGLTSMIVHDLKNPLNTILGITEKQEVLQAARQMLNMVFNILDVQKFENTKFQLQISQQRLIRIIYNSLNQVRLLLERKSIEVINQIPNHIVVSVDVEVIERVMINLLTNAIKFTPNNGKITLYINPDFVKPTQGQVTIAIADLGTGIPEDKLEVIFEKFAQVEALKSGEVRSTGLGLTFCKMAVESHKGQIGVVSKNGEGATFWFSLPLAKVHYEPNLFPMNDKLLAKKIVLSPQERMQLSPFFDQLKKLTVYEYSDVKSILDEIEAFQEENIHLWKQQIENALKACNEEKYEELLSI